MNVPLKCSHLFECQFLKLLLLSLSPDSNFFRKLLLGEILDLLKSPLVLFVDDCVELLLQVVLLKASTQNLEVIEQLASANALPFQVLFA